MSKRGRGGTVRGAGRGRGRGGKQRIGGQEVSWDYDPELIIDTKPQNIFPEIKLPKPRPATALEKRQVEYYRAIRKRIHEGPFYTVHDDKNRIGKAQVAKAASKNPFESMSTYTQRYRAPSRQFARFDTREYDLRFFPRELWDTVDPTRAKALRTTKTTTVKASRTIQLEGEHDEEEEAKGVDGEEEEQVVTGNDEEAEEEENMAEDFSDNDSEMAGDYNAEQYFSGGEGDGEDGGGDGDDGGFD